MLAGCDGVVSLPIHGKFHAEHDDAPCGILGGLRESTENRGFYYWIQTLLAHLHLPFIQAWERFIC